MFVTILIVSTALTGFAHSAPSASERVKLSYILAGADLSGLCGDEEGDAPACEACRTPDPPEPFRADRQALWVMEWRALTRIRWPEPRPAPRQVRDPGHGMRSPPVIPLT